MPVVKLSPNVPIQLALIDTEGELDSRYDQVHYQTTQGTLTVSTRVATQINLLELRTNEPFVICKRQKPEGVEYDVHLAGSAESHRAWEEIDKPTELESQLQKSLEAATPRQPLQAVPRKMPKRAANPDQPRLFDKGTGTDGPAPQPKPAIPAMPPGKPSRVQIPYNVAFREVTKFVTAELKATGEQWSDQARQDMISTILIAAAKAGMLTLWERES